ncbi:MAG: DUF2141 domain-containing protein [Gammaproteobacteria bacterium]|nr:DUF2141 domain-containing protein [Gammaproteobacteria bacterium]
MKKALIILLMPLTMIPFAYANDNETFSLTVKVDELRNSKGEVQFALYNKDGTIPDKKFKHYFRKQNGKINEGSAYTVFNDLPKGRYAVNILHDENLNGKIDKGFILPVEGVGFSNYATVGPGNRPKFLKASFEIISDTEKLIKIKYF